MIFYNNQIDETFKWICIFRKLCTILMKLNILGRKILPIKKYFSISIGKSNKSNVCREVVEEYLGR